MSQRRAEDVERKGGAVWRLAFGVWRSRCLLRLPAREAMLGALIASAGLTIAVAGYQAPQAPHVAEIEKVKDGLYLITGGGGNTSAFITDNGVVVIDTKLKGWGQAILTKIKSVTDKPVTMIINTHTHWDHTGSNADFPATVDFVAQENTKINMAKETCTVVGNCGAFTGENRKYLPKRTFKDKMSLLSGKDRIDLYYFGPGHTNGDAIVVFAALRTAHLADLFARKAVPNVMPSDGGSAVRLPETLGKVVAGIKDVDTVITGHSTTMTWQELQEFAAFNRDFLSSVQAAMRAGKTVDEAAAAQQALAGKYKGYTIDPAKTKENTRYIYDELHLSGRYVP